MATATSTTSSNTSMAPERSLNQRMDALARANQIRIQRAQLKRDLKSGRLSIHALLLNPPEYVETAKVFDMLLAVPKYGRVKVNKILALGRASPDLGTRVARRGTRVRHHRSVGGRQGDADPRADGAAWRARAVGVGDHARATRGRGRWRRLPLPEPRGVRPPGGQRRVRRARRLRRPQLRD